MRSGGGCAWVSPPAATTSSSPVGVEMFRFNLLVVAALRAGERPDLPGTVGRDDGGLVPVVDKAAALALLPEGHDRAALVYDLAARHLYRQSALPPRRVSLPPYSNPLPPSCRKFPPVPRSFTILPPVISIAKARSRPVVSLYPPILSPSAPISR